MVTHSCFYRCRVMHHRLGPVDHRFSYGVFMFSLDLDEIPEIARRLSLFGHNRKNLFEFREKDHNPSGAGSLKEQVILYARSHGVGEGIERVTLITHLRTMGYFFNPVSFYFCSGAGGAPVCCVAEVMNTYRERKLFLLGPDRFDGEAFRARFVKYFYVSPFVDLDDVFDFRLGVPGGGLRITIDDIDKRGRKFLVTSLNGERRELTNARLLGYAFRFPWITLGVLAGIHWQALRLYLKKLPYHTKASDKDLQREVYSA